MSTKTFENWEIIRIFDGMLVWQLYSSVSESHEFRN